MFSSPCRLAVLGILMLLVQACGGKPVLPEPTPPLALALTVVAAPDINPDLNGRPSPVAVALFQLKSAEGFGSADFFSLFDPVSVALGADLISREQITIQPGETRVLTVDVAADARFLGAAAAYRDLEQADWRTVLPLESVRKDRGKKKIAAVTLRLEGRTVAIAVVQR